MSAEPTDDRLFRSVFEGWVDALLMVGDDGECLDANDAACDLFGISRAVLVGRNLADFESSNTDFESVWEDVLQEGQDQGTLELLFEGDNTKAVEFAAQADVFPGIHLAAMRDVTARETDRSALHRQTELLTNVFETSPVGIVVVDTDGSIVDVNGRSTEILGLERSKLTRRTYDDSDWQIIDEDGDEIPADELPVTRVLETDEPVFGFDHGIVDSGGDVRWLSVNAAPIHGEDGAIEQVVMSIEDVTDEREYRRLLETQNERLEEYSATVSHDIRSPLSVASGWVDIAIEEDSTEDLDKARDALERMGHLITNLRTLGRYGQTVKEPGELSIATVVEEAWRHVETDDARLHIEDCLGDVHGDESRVLQLFENLFRNSIEHAGPNVTVRVGPLDGGFYVEDDGPGIPVEGRDQVFEFGYSTCEDGTGLGLAVVEAIVDAHGWELTLTEAEPRGVRFEFRPRWHPDVSG